MNQKSAESATESDPELSMVHGQPLQYKRAARQNWGDPETETGNVSTLFVIVKVTEVAHAAGPSVVEV
jgi:hypothetical protein